MYRKSLTLNFVGPVVGSGLYQVGGFLLPFLIVGIWCFISAIGISFVIPNVKMNDSEDETEKKKLSFVESLKVNLDYVKNICLCRSRVYSSGES